MRETDFTQAVDTLLGEPYWVIDLLPMQVPEGGAARFFPVESFLLSEPRIGALRRKWADLLLKLNCYFDLLLCGEAGELYAPAPEELWNRVRGGEHLALLLETENALVVVDGDSTCMTVYRPTERLLSIVRALASAEGLFVWQPEFSL